MGGQIDVVSVVNSFQDPAPAPPYPGDDAR
jgi:hypothetical protein